MRCPTLNELPPPPPDKTGWPWTEETPQISGFMPDGTQRLKVSIITPSYNQDQYIEATIRSVLLQGYPDLEFIIIDGNSTDGSKHIIKKYEPWLAYWVSEPDRGQANAINKGFLKSNGQIIAWLNTDDTYFPSTILQVSEILSKPNANIVCANCNLVDSQGQLMALYKPHIPITIQTLLMYWKYHYATPPQPTVFFSRRVFETIGLLNESLNFALDYEYWLRVTKQFEFKYVDAIWADYLVHENSKTGSGWLPFLEEIFHVGKEHQNRLSTYERLKYSIFGKQRALGRYYRDLTLKAIAQKDFTSARRLTTQAIRYDPICLFDLSLLALLKPQIKGIIDGSKVIANVNK